MFFVTDLIDCYVKFGNDELYKMIDSICEDDEVVKACLEDIYCVCDYIEIVDVGDYYNNCEIISNTNFDSRFYEIYKLIGNVSNDFEINRFYGRILNSMFMLINYFDNCLSNVNNAKEKLVKFRKYLEDTLNVECKNNKFQAIIVELANIIAFNELTH